MCKLNFDSELLSHSKLTNPSVIQDIDSRRFLKDGDSAWISGHVTFSLPIVYRGCYEPKSNNFVVFDPVEFEIKSIYSCINYCLNDVKFKHFSTEFFGITKDICLCLNKIDLNRLSSAADSRCDSECSAFDIDSCGGEGVISVYKLYKNETLLWAKNGRHQGQCVYAKLKDNRKRIKTYTASCFETAVKASGYFCQYGAHSQLDRTCSVRDKTRRYCLVNTSSSRQSAKEGCAARSGVLVGINSEQHIMELMQYNSYYWLGIHKAYTVTKTRTAVSTACLSVTKINDTLNLNPDNCDKTKFFFCDTTNSMTESMTSSFASVGSLGTSKRYNTDGPVSTTTKKVRSSTDTPLYTTVHMITKGTKQNITKQDGPTTQKPKSTSGISRDKFKITIDSKLESPDTVDTTELSPILINGTTITTKQKTTYSFVSNQTSGFKLKTPEGTSSNRTRHSNYTVDHTEQGQSIEMSSHGSTDISETWTIVSNTQNSNTNDLDPSSGSTVSTVVLAVAVAVLILIVITTTIVIKKRCHRGGGSNSKVKKSPKKKLEPYCIEDGDSVIQTGIHPNMRPTDFASHYQTTPSTQSAVYDVPDDVVRVMTSFKPERKGELTTSFKPGIGDQLEDNHYDTLALHYQPHAKCTYETYGTGARLNTYDHGIVGQTNNSNNYYILEKIEQ